MSRDTLRRFVFFVYVLMFIHLWHRAAAIKVAVSKFNKLMIRIDIALSTILSLTIHFSGLGGKEPDDICYYL